MSQAIGIGIGIPYPSIGDPAFFGAPADPHPGNDILLEDGSYILQEDGTSTILLEA